MQKYFPLYFLHGISIPACTTAQEAVAQELAAHIAGRDGAERGAGNSIGYSTIVTSSQQTADIPTKPGKG